MRSGASTVTSKVTGPVATRFAIRATLAAALCLAASLPALSADNRTAASLRIQVSVAPTVVMNAAQSNLSGDLQLPASSETRVVSRDRSEWSTQSTSKKAYAQAGANTQHAELVTTIIVPR